MPKQKKMVVLREMSREDVLSKARAKITMGQLICYDTTRIGCGEDIEVLRKVPGGWEVITQRPVYTHLYIVTV